MCHFIIKEITNRLITVQPNSVQLKMSVCLADLGYGPSYMLPNHTTLLGMLKK